MDPKLRIMTIRLMKKIAEHPEYAAWIGVEGNMTETGQIKVCGQNETRETSR